MRRQVLQLWKWYSPIIILNLDRDRVTSINTPRRTDVCFHGCRYWELCRISRKLEEEAWKVGRNQASCRESWSRRWDSHISVWLGMIYPPMESTSTSRSLLSFISVSPTRMSQAQGSLRCQVQWLPGGGKAGPRLPSLLWRGGVQGIAQHRVVLKLPIAASFKTKTENKLLINFYAFASKSFFHLYLLLKNLKIVC